MLSGHSFNALLKTLEEPPPHVKFLLATTDPQKLPVTILSRCLQFNLKHLTIEQIERQLQQILLAEQLDYEAAALKPLAIAADGSMRDALSLLDQSIAYSSGRPNLLDVEAMLGCVQKERVFEIITALANGDGASLIEQSRKLTEQGLDVTTLLAEIISMLQRIALCQLVPEAIDDSLGDQSVVEQMAQLLTPEDVQLFYQIALNGRKDLPHSPLPEGGFEMILLRMLAFRPVNISRQNIQLPLTETKNVEKKTPEVVKKKPEVDLEQTKVAVEQAESRKQKAEAGVEQANEFIVPESTFFDLPPLEAYSQESSLPLESDQLPPYEPQEPGFSQLNPVEIQAKTLQSDVSGSQAGSSAEVIKKNIETFFSDPIHSAAPCETDLTDELANDWYDLINRCNMNGLERQLARHCALESRNEENQQIIFNLLIEAVHMHLLSDKMQQRILGHLQKLLGQPVILNIRQCHTQNKLHTPQLREILETEARQQEAVDSILNDPRVGLLIDAFDAKVIEKTIRPLSN
jgi:DNA polymerase-3 subunit gamma/tau